LELATGGGPFRGMLLGFRDECFDVGAWRQGTFFISAPILQRKNNMKWCFFLVYGPADHRRTDEFLGELTQAVPISGGHWWGL
jgi:hypothetical protein